MTPLLQSSWAVVLAGTLSYVMGLWFSLPAVVKRLPPRSPAVTERGRPDEPSWNFRNPELDQLITDLAREKEALAVRQQQLNDLAARLATERSELNQTLSNVVRMQKEFDQNVLRIRDEEVPNLKKLAKVYAAMTPQAALTIFKELEDDKIVKILTFLKDSEAAPILESMAKAGEAEAKRAAAITERVRLSISRTNSNRIKIP